MLLQRSIRTGSSIFAHYRATGRSLAHGLCLLKRREKRRCSFSTQSSKLVYPAAHVTIGEHDATLSQQILDVPRQELLIFSSSGRNSPVGFARTHEGAWAQIAPLPGDCRGVTSLFSLGLAVSGHPSCAQGAKNPRNLTPKWLLTATPKCHSDSLNDFAKQVAKATMHSSSINFLCRYFLAKYRFSTYEHSK